MSTDFAKLLELTGPHCEESQPWLEGKSFEEAWASCDRGDWALKVFAGMVGQPGWPSHQEVVRVACDILELIEPMLKVTGLTLDTLRRWTRGEATAQDVLITKAEAINGAQSAKTQGFRSASYAADAVCSCCDYIRDGSGITAACIVWGVAIASGNPRQTLKFAADYIKDKLGRAVR